MRRNILILSLLAVAAVWLLWPGSERAVAPAAKSTLASVTKVSAVSSVATNQPTVASVQSSPSAVSATNRFPYRLANTPKTIGELTVKPHAILLENALIDTELKPDLSIPKHLRAGGEPGAFIVQARGVIGAAFRAALAGAGAEIVSYIPNNAYLVRLSAAGAAGLSGHSLVQAVLPYEPYYKVQTTLLDRAVNQKPLPFGTDLTIGIFASGAADTEEVIKKLGAKIVSRDRTPFGSMVRVQPAQDWIALAQLPGVQLVELARERKVANDLTRVTMGVSTTSVAPDNYLGLTGSNVVVEVNDTGVDRNHPDLTGRVNVDIFGSGIDTDGHGTHVAGTIAGDGTESTTVVFASGSSNPGEPLQYRGKAPSAKLFSLGVIGGYDAFNFSDSYLQEQPARANALISNNSWRYTGDAQYDLASASYDAAVRDALPENTGSQPVLFVFAAGNEGGGNNDGTGGFYDSVASPATAKNIITVGAIEQSRNISNYVSYVDGTSNQVWLPLTDTGYQVASFSSRGNVGVGTEGTYGRFKPDVVAPGTMVVSARSTTWDTNSYYGSGSFTHRISREYLLDTNLDSYIPFYVAANTTNISINIAANFFSPTPFPTLQMFVSTNANVSRTVNEFSSTTFPVNIPPSGGPNYLQDILAGGGWLYLLVTDYTNTIPVDYNLVITTITTNDNGNFSQVLQGMNDQLGPYYRYENGTSQATPAVSGTLALMQDFFTNTLHLTPSPALLKAMLINGARVTGGNIFAVNQAVNYQGWGLPQLPNSIPQNLTNTASSLYFLDQSPTNVLATGDSRTFIVQPGNPSQPLRITLAWTDPPGNPAAAVKLVNNLDLVVTNLTTGAIYYGNYFVSGGNPPYSIASTNTDAPQFDLINNVENVYIAPSLGARYSVTVIGRSVNVNAVTAEPANIVQDFSLVVSLGDNSSSSLVVTPDPVAPAAVPSPVTVVVGNIGFYSGQLAGANAPVLSTNFIPFGTNSGFATNAVLYVGQTNQWHFYVVTNTTIYTNVAFVTYNPNTLAIPREGVFAYYNGNSTRPEADIDLYVATYPADPNAAGLLNLDPAVLANCINGLNGGAAALSRNGTDFVAFTNAAPGNVYFVGVKCEDQMGAEYGFISAISEKPFSSLDENGNQLVPGFNVPLAIPDGDNAHPVPPPDKLTPVTGLALYPMEIKRVIASTTINHQNYGDLYGALDHDKIGVYLNVHDDRGPGIVSMTYDDSGQTDITPDKTSGPGSLTNFVATKAQGPWMLYEIDDAHTQTGTNTDFSVKIEPHQPTNDFYTVTIQPNTWFYDYAFAPAGYTNLTIIGIDETGPPVLQLYEKFNGLPTLTSFDNRVVINLPYGPGWYSNSISIGPPLATGFYIYGIYNSDTVAHTVQIGAFLSYPPWATRTVAFTSSGPLPLKDDAVTTDSISVTDTEIVAGINVGLRVNHPRISDLVFHLIDPYGTRYLLMENRGNTSPDGCGITGTATQTGSGSPSGGMAEYVKLIDTGTNVGTITIDYQMYGIPDRMVVYNGTNVIYDTGMVSGTGHLVLNYSNSTIITIVMNPGGGNLGTAWNFTYTAPMAEYYYLTFTEDTSLTTTPIKFAPTPFVPATATNLYYLPEQSLSALAGTSAYGTWQLEVLDNRVGATNPAPELLSWQMELVYIQAYPYLLGFTPQTATVAATTNSIVWYQVFVPTNASFATNILRSSTRAVNLWFSTNGPPTMDIKLLNNRTTGTSILSTNTTPRLVPGSMYWLGVQNNTGNAATFRLEVDFDHGNPIGSGGPASVKIASAKATANGPQLEWTNSPGSHYQLQWKDSLSDPWNTITNPPISLLEGASGVASFTDDGSQTAPVTGQRFYRLVWVP